MNLRNFLLCTFVILLFIFLNHKTALYNYWGALVITVTYLHSRKQYLLEPYKWFNALFLLYLIFVVWERTRHYHFLPIVELWLINLEHILFGVMVCFIATRVLKFSPFDVHRFGVRLLFGILIFNTIGFINEWFQNTLQHRSFFTLIPDSQKDIRMNVIGSILFLAAALVLKKIINQSKIIAKQ